jgi:D-glycero-D-manno-heptose 1,7-bisphosphate phosphatase
VPGKPNRRAAFLDRDGTLMVDHGYVGRAEAVELLPDVGRGLRLLSQQGFALVVVTNQSGVDRGYFTLDDVEAVNTRLSEMLLSEDVELAGFYVCPHGPAAGCDCRKPRAGLAYAAAAEHDLDPRGSIVIGDKESDVELGLAIGARTILLAPEGRRSRGARLGRACRDAPRLASGGGGTGRRRFRLICRPGDAVPRQAR